MPTTIIPCHPMESKHGDNLATELARCLTDYSVDVTHQPETKTIHCKWSDDVSLISSDISSLPPSSMANGTACAITTRPPKSLLSVDSHHLVILISTDGKTVLELPDTKVNLITNRVGRLLHLNHSSTPDPAVNGTLAKPLARLFMDPCATYFTSRRRGAYSLERAKLVGKEVWKRGRDQDAAEVETAVVEIGI